MAGFDSVACGADDQLNRASIHSGVQTDSGTVLEVRHVWKKYCRQLRRALRYGVADIGRQLWPLGSKAPPSGPPRLRPGEFFSVRDASFELHEGECLGVIGPNGAGKSTMLKLINGLIRPDAGSIRIRGRTGALIELGTGFNPVLSGRENVFVNAAVLGLTRRQTQQKFDAIVDFAGLSDVINDPIRTYSSGMKVRLGFAIAAHLDPDLLILDEVLAVGDVGFRLKCFRYLNELPARGTSVLIVTHAVSMLPRVCSRTVVFDRGQIVYDGDVQQAIAVYEQCLSLPVHSGADEAAASERTTEGSARIRKVTVESLSGRPVHALSTGDGLRMRIEVQCDEPVPRAKFVVALYSPKSETICSVSSELQQLRPDLPPGVHSVELVFPALPLLVGGYRFNVSLFGADLLDFRDRVTGVGAFQVTGPPVDANGDGWNGLVRLEHLWQGPDPQAGSSPPAGGTLQ